MKKLILMILSAAFLLSGCSARAAELEDSAVVRAIAIDRAEKGYSVSAYIAGAEEGSVISAEAETIAEAVFQLNTRTERRIYLGQLRVIVISSELRDVEEPLLYLYAAEDVRSAAKVLIVSGSAKETLSYKGLYRDAASDIEKTVENANENANYPAVTLYGCVNSMAAESGCCILPVGKLQEENLCVEKSAVYRDYCVLQTLTPEELAGSAVFCEKEQIYLPVDGMGMVLTDLCVKNSGESRFEVSCKYRMVAEGGESLTGTGTLLEQKLAEVMREVYETARKVDAVLPGMYPCDFERDAEITVTAKPAYNDYPIKGVNAE